MKAVPERRDARPHLVTEARRPMSEDISYRKRRYLIMMGFRVVCFLLAVVLFTRGAGWFALIPAVGAIVIPYFAVIFANGGREPTRTRGLREYQPNLPDHPGAAAAGPETGSWVAGQVKESAPGPDGAAGPGTGAGDEPAATPATDPAPGTPGGHHR